MTRRLRRHGLTILAVLLPALVAACGGTTPGTATGGGTPGGAPGETPAGTPAPPIANEGGGTLPESGVRARVVNFYADAEGPQDLDIYGITGNTIISDEVRVATAAYGTVSDWFDPGYAEGSRGERLSAVNFHRAGDPHQFSGISNADAEPGTVMTVIVSPSDDLGARVRAAFDDHPDSGRGDIPQPIPDKGVLVTSSDGLPGGGFSGATHHASVGDGCLPGRFSDPELEKIVGHPLPQPVGNDLVVEPGSYELTIHRDESAPGEIATCDGTPVARATLDIAAGQRVYAILYPGTGPDGVNVLVLPFEE